MAAKLAGVPRIVRTVHGLREPMQGLGIGAGTGSTKRSMHRRCVASRTVVIAVSRRTAEALERSGYQAVGRSVRIHNGVDSAESRPSAIARRSGVSSALGHRRS